MSPEQTLVEAVGAVRDTLAASSLTVGGILRFREAARDLRAAAAAAPRSVPVDAVVDALEVAFETHASQPAGAASLFGVDTALADAFHACLEVVALATTTPGAQTVAEDAWRRVVETLPADVDASVRFHALAAAAALGGPGLHRLVADSLEGVEVETGAADAHVDRYLAETAAHLARTTPHDGRVATTLQEAASGDDALTAYWRTVATVRLRADSPDAVDRRESLRAGLGGLFDGTTTPTDLRTRLQFGRALGSIPRAASSRITRHAIEAATGQLSNDEPAAERIGTHALWALLTDAGRNPGRTTDQLARTNRHASLFGFGSETPKAVGIGIGLVLRSLPAPRRRQIAATVVDLFDPDSDRYLLHSPPTDKMNARWTAPPRDLYRCLEAAATRVDDEGTLRVFTSAIAWGVRHPHYHPRSAAVDAAGRLRQRTSPGSAAARNLERALEGALRDDDDPVRERAVTALLPQGEDGAVPSWARRLLLDTLDAPEREARLRSAHALADVGDALPERARRRLVERVTAEYAASGDSEALLAVVERCCRTLHGERLEAVAAIAREAIDRDSPPVAAVDAVAELAGNDDLALPSATLERLVALAVDGGDTRVRATAIAALQTTGPITTTAARESTLESLRALLFGVPASVRQAAAGLAGQHAHALEDDLVGDCLAHHDAGVTDAFVDGARARSGARTETVPLPDPTGFEFLLRRAIDRDEEPITEVLVGVRSLEALTDDGRERYVDFLTSALAADETPSGSAAVVPHALGIVRESSRSSTAEWSESLQGLAAAVLECLRRGLLDDDWLGGRRTVTRLFEDALPLLDVADATIQEALATAATDHAKVRQGIYEDFPGFYDALSGERRRDWLEFLVALPVAAERTPHAVIECLPELAARPTVDDSTLRAFLRQVAGTLSPEAWSPARDQPGTHIAEHLHALLERRPRVYDAFPVLRRHVLSTADTTNVEYVAALLEFETTAVDQFQ